MVQYQKQKGSVTISSNDRIKFLRENYLHLSQEEFVSNLTMSRSNLANIESSAIHLTDRVAREISNAYNINIDWIQDGVGSVFQDSTDQERILAWAEKLVSSANCSDNFAFRFAVILSKLDKNEWKLLENIAMKLADKKLNIEDK